MSSLRGRRTTPEAPHSKKSYVETVARELLSAGWRPKPDQCFVARGDGAAPRLVDYDVWLAMGQVMEAEKPGSTGAQGVAYLE